MNRDDLALYVMGIYDGDAAALEQAIAGNAAAQAIVAEEAGLEALLRDAAAAAAFCPACDDLVHGARCEACGAALRPGGYVVERVLVSNAHGRMYVARDADGTRVALKERAFVQSPGPEVVAAFEREARFLRALEHPAIPKFRASFQEGTGVATRYYLAQDLVDGESLAARLEQHFFTEAEIVAIARQVLDVLVYLQGLAPMVIHRDIKPANLVVRADGSLAVVDFGAAYVQGSTIGSTTIGTFGYMPVEQLAGLVDATTDGYALGASLVHLLTRQEPWRLIQGSVLAGLNVGRPVRAFLAKLIALDPRARYRSAAEARAAVGRLEPRAATTRREPRAEHRRAPRWVVAAAAVAMAASGGGYAAWRMAARPERLAGPSVRVVELELGTSEARGLVDELDRIAAASCACADRRCADGEVARLEAWTHAWAGLNARSFDELIALTQYVTPRVGRASHEMSACLTKLYTIDAMEQLRQALPDRSEQRLLHLLDTHRGEER
jgi:hypothetical protein